MPTWVTISLLVLALSHVQGGERQEEGKIQPLVPKGYRLWRVGTVSMYRPWLDWEALPSGRRVRRPGRYACNPRRLPRTTDRVCASRSLPCGATLWLARRTAGGRVIGTRCIVLDRGPYGVCVPRMDERSHLGRPFGCPRGYARRVFRKSRLSEAEKLRGIHWRAELDLAEGVTRALGGRGMIEEVWISVKE